MTTPVQSAAASERIASIVLGALANPSPRDEGEARMGSEDLDVQSANDDAPLPEDDGPVYDEPGDLPKGGLPPEKDLMLIDCAQERQNDTGNARRFRRRYGDLAKEAQAVVHVENIGWYCWDNRRWKEDGDDRGIRPLAQTCADLISREALLIKPTPDEAEAIEAAVSAGMKIEALEAELDAVADDDDDAKDKRVRLKKSISGLGRIVAHGEAVDKRIGRRKTDRLRHANSSGNKGKLDGMLNEARPYVSRQIRDFDRAELDLNLDNGTLFFGSTLEQDLDCPDPDVVRMVRRWQVGMRGHVRGDFNTKLAPVFWCPEAKAPSFDAFLRQVMPSEPLRLYLRRFFGYCLTRRTSEQMFCIFFGGGRNGKSTLVDLIARILDDYATTVPVASLMAENARKAQDATPDLNRLPGARFVRTSEPKEGLAINEGLVKELTGGEPINLRRLNQESIEVYPEFKLVISCNSKPRILGNDEGIWRRIALVPFDVQIPKDQVDKALPDKLWAERAGVLNWMIEGCLDYLALGSLAPPKEIQDATNEYRLAEDPIGKFILAALDVTRDPNDLIESGRMLEGYLAYAKRFNEPMLGDATFRRKMPKAAEDHGFIKGKSSVSIYQGVRFKPGFEPSSEPSHTRYGSHRG